MTPPIDEQKDLETLAAAIRRWENAPRFDLLLTPYEGWVTMGGIQMCLRNEALPPHLRELLTRVGRRLQPLMCDTPALDDIAERGWHSGYDQPADPAPSNLGLPSGEPQVAPQHAGSVWKCSHPECVRARRLHEDLNRPKQEPR